MKIGEEVYVHGYIDEIRKDTVIIKNEGGYFGTAKEEIVDSKDVIKHVFNNDIVVPVVDRVLEVIDMVIEGQVKQAERFNGNGCRLLAKTHQDQAYGAQMAKQAVLALKEGEQE